MEPNFSGKFVLRLPAELHKRLNAEAKKQGQSLNNICLKFLSQGLDPKKENKGSGQKYRGILKMLKQHFKAQLLGILIFGSQISGEATASSDVDFLIILSSSIPLTRSLYSWWDKKIGGIAHPKEELNSQFVHLPTSPLQAGGLWFEVALAHEILWERGSCISSFLKGLKGMISEGEVRRFTSHGQPFWVWRENEKQVANH